MPEVMAWRISIGSNCGNNPVQPRSRAAASANRAVDFDSHDLMSSARIIQALGQIPGVSSLLRWVARQYPEGSVVSIKHGEAAGFRWKRHHRYVNGYWIGQYELPIQMALKRELRAGDTFFDVGANAGFFTLVAANLVGPTGKCVSFDPLPANVESLHEQVELNGLTYCQVDARAVGDAVGEAIFYFDYAGDPQGHLGELRRESESHIKVNVTTLDQAVEQWGAPAFIKLDVEGAEDKVLEGARQTIERVKPSWLIEIHTPQCEAAVRETLKRAGYAFFQVSGEAITEGSVLPNHVIARHRHHAV
jgi:FkbM family methyltransferase